jgi:peptidoglycan/LPS O-acetylase OafA/YrhL
VATTESASPASVAGDEAVPAAATDSVPAVAESPRREMSGGVHFGALDGYRAIAALMVVLTHVATTSGSTDGWLGHALGRFDFGVPLFFLMSGFLLYRPWAKSSLDATPRPDTRRYAIRRAARILPLYWVVVVVVLTTLPEIQPVPRDQWVMHLLGLQIYQPGGPIEGLYQTWSLCTEISFYVVLPYLGWIGIGRTHRDPDAAWRRQMWLIGVLVAGSWIWNLYRFTHAETLPYNAQLWLPGYFDWFGAGMLLALISVRSRRAGAQPWIVRTAMALAKDQVTCLVIALSVFAIVCTPVAGAYLFVPNTPSQNIIKHALYLLAALFFLIPGVLAPPRGWTAWLTKSVPHRLGLISYGIFLWHLFLLRLILPALGIEVFTGHAWELAGVLLVSTIAVASVTYLLVERPAQRWAHRF